LGGAREEIGMLFARHGFGNIEYLRCVTITAASSVPPNRLVAVERG